MKKVLSILLIAGISTFVACGPSAEEKAAAEKHVKDSTEAANIEKARQDSLTAVANAEKAKAEAAAAEAEKAKQDSLAAAAKKPAPKAKAKTNDQKMKDDKKVLQKQKG